MKMTIHLQSTCGWKMKKNSTDKLVFCTNMFFFIVHSGPQYDCTCPWNVFILSYMYEVCRLMCHHSYLFGCWLLPGLTAYGNNLGSLFQGPTLEILNQEDEGGTMENLFKAPRWFQWAIRFGNHCLTPVRLLCYCESQENLGVRSRQAQKKETGISFYFFPATLNGKKNILLIKVKTEKP